MSNNSDRRHLPYDGEKVPSLVPPRHRSFTRSAEESLEEGRPDFTVGDVERVEDYDYSQDEYTNVDMEQEPVRVIRTVKYVTRNDTSSDVKETTTRTTTAKHDKKQEESFQGEVGFCQVVPIHLKRVIQWRLASIAPTPKEAKALDQAEVTNDMLRAYLVWRRSMLLVSLPIVFVSAILAYVNLASSYKSDTEVFNGLGDVLAFIPSTASTMVFIAIIVVLFRWSHWRQSAKIFRIGWSLSFIIPFIPALFPVSFLLISCEEVFEVSGCSQTETNSYNLAVADIEFAYAISYAIELFPILITFPGGLSRAALKIRGLLPESTLSSWILVITSPFQSVIFIMALVALIQLSGNVFLFIGTILLVCAPWIYVIRRKVYIFVPTEKREKQLDRTQFAIGTCVKLGFIFFLIWAFTGDVGGVPILGSGDRTNENFDEVYYIISYTSLVRVIFESIGRILVTTVLFADVLFRMTITNWRQDTGRREADKESGSIDDAFRSMENSITSQKKKKKRNDDSDEEQPTLDPRTSSEDEEPM